MAISNLINGISSAKEIVFFDLETNVPNKTNHTKFYVLEFGAIVICPRTLMEIESFCTLIKPSDLSVVAIKPGRVGGINREEVANAPCFEEVARKIFSILDGRIWAGHNIQRFDCVRIREAFAEINMPPPVPAAIIDSLGVLSQKFGKRAGNMKMATLADYFGLGQQKHRSLEDARMNLEVLKHCATVLLLESSLPPSVLSGRHYANNNFSITTRSRSLLEKTSSASIIDMQKGKYCMAQETSGREELRRKSPPSTLGVHQRSVPYARKSLGMMTTRMKKLLCSGSNSLPLTNLLKHSQSLIR